MSRMFIGKTTLIASLLTAATFAFAQDPRQEPPKGQNPTAAQIPCPSLALMQQSADRLDTIWHDQKEKSAYVAYSSRVAFEQNKNPWYVAVIVPTAKSSEEAMTAAKQNLKGVSIAKSDYAEESQYNSKVSYCIYGAKEDIIAYTGTFEAAQTLLHR